MELLPIDFSLFVRARTQSGLTNTCQNDVYQGESKAQLKQNHEFRRHVPFAILILALGMLREDHDHVETEEHAVKEQTEDWVVQTVID